MSDTYTVELQDGTKHTGISVIAFDKIGAERHIRRNTDAEKISDANLEFMYFSLYSGLKRAGKIDRSIEYPAFLSDYLLDAEVEDAAEQSQDVALPDPTLPVPGTGFSVG